VHVVKRGRTGDELLVDARLVVIAEGVRDLDDDHAIQQGLVLLLLHEPMELREVRMGDDRLVQMNQWETRHLDVLFLGQREEEVEKFTLDLKDLNHLEQTAAGGVDRA
jgi:hypothetical protein